MKAVWSWALVAGCAFLVSYLLEDASDGWDLAVSTTLMLLLGASRAKRVANGLVWACAYLIAASLVGVQIGYVVTRWSVILLIAGALAGFFEPTIRERNRLLNGVAWAVALPVGFYIGIVASIFLDQPLDLILAKGFVVGRGLGGAIGGLVAYGLGEKLSALDQFRVARHAQSTSRP